MRKSFFSNFDDDISQISTENEASFEMPTGNAKFGALTQKADLCGKGDHAHSDKAKSERSSKQSKGKRKKANLTG